MRGFAHALIAQRAHYARAKRTAQLVRGFTFIELIVVIAIIGIVSAVVFTGVRTGEKALLLDRVSYTVAQDIRLAMDYALRVHPDPGLCTGASEQLIGYGIHFHEDNPLFYEIFANCKNTSNDKEIMRALETINLEKGVEIADITFTPGPAGDPVPWKGTRISFMPPDPKSQISWDHVNNNVNEKNKVTITLRLESGASQIRKVSVTNKGVIEIK